MSDQMEPPSSDPIEQIGTMVFLPMALSSALELEVFTVLGEAPMTVQQIAAKIGVKPRLPACLALAVGSAAWKRCASQGASSSPRGRRRSSSWRLLERFPETTAEEGSGPVHRGKGLQADLRAVPPERRRGRRKEIERTEQPRGGRAAG